MSRRSASSPAHGSALAGASLKRTCRRASAAVLAGGGEHQGHGEGVRNRPGAAQGLGVLRVVGHQQHRPLLDLQLRERLEQSGAEACVVGAQRVRCGGSAGGDAPVAGGRVVHRVVEARGRELPLARGQRAADLVQVLAVAAGGAEDGRQLGRVGAGAAAGLESCRDGDPHRHPGAPPLGARQAGERGDDGRCGGPGNLAGEHARPLLPVADPRPEQADAFDEAGQCGQGRTRGCANTRLQLEPPKPNELLMT